MTTDAPGDQRSDEQLIEAINYGDEQAFASLYMRYRDWTTRLAYRFTRDEHLSLDVMQETFSYLLRKVPHLYLAGRLTTFIYPVVQHLSQQHLRARKPTTDTPTDFEAPFEVPAVDSNDARNELAAVLRTLSDEQRQVVLMRYVDDLAIREIALVLSIAEGTVKTRLHHALNKLRDDPRTKKYFFD